MEFIKQNKKMIVLALILVSILSFGFAAYTASQGNTALADEIATFNADTEVSKKLGVYVKDDDIFVFDATDHVTQSDEDQKIGQYGTTARVIGFTSIILAGAVTAIG